VHTQVLFIVTILGIVGIGTIVWATAGIARRLAAMAGPHDRPRERVAPGGVAIVIAAHNEQLVIEKTLDSASAQVPIDQVYVASDGSTDSTAEIAAGRGAHVLELSPNRGKAGAIVAAIEHFALAEHYDVVMLLDADTVLTEDYLSSGLPMFDDPGVVAVAGQASSILSPAPPTLMGKILVTYRERVYLAVQYLLKYGQAARAVNVVSIVPGFASMYRTAVLGFIDIDAPGLSIEDYNMTFEIHAKSLGRIAFRPGSAVALTQDPDRLGDYVTQVGRWSLGFWQTLLRHGWQPRLFFLVTWLSACELIVSCAILLLALPVAALSGMADLLSSLTWDPSGIARDLSSALPAWVLVLGVAVPDLALSLIVAIATRNARFLLFAPAFPLLRILDAALCLRAARRALSGSSSTVWQSPERRADSPQSEVI
jgi:biofilm PGA synthesis N-glycosyltransferase PgaC